jgi:hypothetical protein
MEERVRDKGLVGWPKHHLLCCPWITSIVRIASDRTLLFEWQQMRGGDMLDLGLLGSIWMYVLEPRIRNWH